MYTSSACVYACAFRVLKEAAGELRWTSRDKGYNQNGHHSGRSVWDMARLLHDLCHRWLVHVMSRPTQTLRLLLLARLRQLRRQSHPLYGVQGGLSRSVSPANVPSPLSSVAHGRGLRGSTPARTRLLGSVTANMASRRQLAAALLNSELWPSTQLHFSHLSDTCSMPRLSGTRKKLYILYLIRSCRIDNYYFLF